MTSAAVSSKMPVIEFEVTPRVYLALMGKESQDCPLLSSEAMHSNRRNENFIKPQFQSTHNLRYSLKKRTTNLQGSYQLPRKPVSGIFRKQFVMTAPLLFLRWFQVCRQKIKQINFDRN